MSCICCKRKPCVYPNCAGGRGGKSVAGELMLLIEIARAAVKYRGPATATERVQDARRLDNLLVQFKKLEKANA